MSSSRTDSGLPVPRAVVSIGASPVSSDCEVWAMVPGSFLAAVCVLRRTNAPVDYHFTALPRPAQGGSESAAVLPFFS